MNAIGMLVQQVITSRGLPGNLGEQSLDKSASPFQDVLKSAQLVSGKTTQLPGEKDMENQSVFDIQFSFPVNQIVDPSVIEKQLAEIMEQAGEILSQITNDQEALEAAPKIVDLLQQWVALKKASGPDPGLVGIDLRNQFSTLINQAEDTLTEASSQELSAIETRKSLEGWITQARELSSILNMPIQQTSALLTQIESITAQLSNQQDLAKAVPLLRELLEQWSMLGTKQNIETGSQLSNEKQVETKGQAAWRELADIYQKRNQLITKQQYRSNADITNKDVAKWITQVNDKVPSQHIVNASSMPMSRIEQYVIHVNQAQGTQPVDSQVIEQFEKLMKTSSFLTMPNGRTQLTISLRPEHLGDMMVRFTQINGEMTVKIAVSSNAAKEMLESNIHQLRNLFSPHQVVIERQELNPTQSQDIQEEADESSKGHEEDESQHHSDEREKHHTTDDFGTQFKDILMNEKV